MIGDRDILIEVDGSIDDNNIKYCKKAGANIFVVGSYLFNGDFIYNLNNLKRKLEENE